MNDIISLLESANDIENTARSAEIISEHLTKRRLSDNGLETTRSQEKSHDADCYTKRQNDIIKSDLDDKSKNEQLNKNREHQEQNDAYRHEKDMAKTNNDNLVRSLCTILGITLGVASCVAVAVICGRSYSNR